MSLNIKISKHTETEKELESIFTEAMTKYGEGVERYGVLDIDHDARDFLFEAEQELIDNINYSAMQIMRLRRLRSGKCRACKEISEKISVLTDKTLMQTERMAEAVVLRHLQDYHCECEVKSE